MKALLLISVSVLLSVMSAAAFAKPEVVLIPGAGSSADHLWLSNLNWTLSLTGGDRYYGRYLDRLHAAGVDAWVCPLDADQDARSVEERTADCVSALQARLGSCAAGAPREIHLVGHSMGGLVAREVAADPSVSACIASVTLISTPNQGTVIADWVVDHSAHLGTSFDLFAQLIELFQFLPSEHRYLPELASTRAQNGKPLPVSLFRGQDVADAAGVRYYSITNSENHIPVAPLLVSKDLITAELKQRGLDKTSYGTLNDGIVPEYSMVHGQVVGHVDAYHWATACVDTVKYAAECDRSEAMLMTHLQTQLGQSPSGF